jgi:maltose-6'-phosphate glucosidase
MEKFKVVIVGGGSTWTPGLLKSLCLKKNEFPLEELRLYDIDEKRQEKIGKFAEILFKEEYPELKFFYTTDKQCAYENVDFVFCQIRTGGYKMRLLDEHIPLSHGVVGQETCGAGGFAYAMRSIRDMIEVVNDARKYSDDPWILNYTNPAAIIAIALDKVFPNDKKIINICDQPVNFLKSYGKMLNIDYNTIFPVYFGLNHFGWFKHLYDKTGKDLVPRIREMILKNGFMPADAEERDKSWLDTYGMVQTILKHFPDYIPNTYLQYYLYPEYKATHTNKDFTRADEVICGREKRVFEECERVQREGIAKGSSIARSEAHSDMIVDVARNIAYNGGGVFIMIAKNNGVISNFHQNAMVECTSIVNSQGVIPFALGEIDVFSKGLMESQYAYETLTVEAYFEGSYKKALQALTLNRTICDAMKAKAILDDLMEANTGYWPELV